MEQAHNPPPVVSPNKALILTLQAVLTKVSVKPSSALVKVQMH